MQGHELLLSISPRWEPHNISPVYYGTPPRPALNSLPSDALQWGWPGQQFRAARWDAVPAEESAGDSGGEMLEDDSGKTRS